VNRYMQKAKSRVRALIVVTVYLLDMSKLLFINIEKNAAIGKTRVIVFHHIDSYRKFRRIIKRVDRLYNCISFSEWVAGKVAKDKVNVIVAFDDGYKSWYTNAFPVLKEFSIKPLMFVNSNFINLDRDSSFEFCRRNIGTWPEYSLNSAQLKEMFLYGCEIGAHTSNHSDMSKLNYKECVKEVNGDISRINNILDAQIEIFAYPFGRISSSAKKAIKDSDISYAFCTKSGLIDHSDSKILLKRTNVGMRAPLVISAYIEGYLDWFTLAFEKFKKKGGV
jgi:peptidoglycan/xylan/chitin deacetylase (PgdA/CDA1 family)